MSRPLPLPLVRIASLVSGELSGGEPRIGLGFAIDSRRVGPGTVFIALKGQRTDGHRFLQEVARRGASAAMVSEDVKAELPLIRVPDTQLALQSLGRAFRELWPLKVVGITGSAGKTTTKEYCAELLAKHFPVFRSEGNFNNLIGLPLTLTRRRPEHSLAVLEMGMSTPGELAELSRLVRPDLAVITNVGRAHQMNFPDLAAIAKAKAGILAGLTEDGVLVFNRDDPHVAAVAKDFKGHSLSYGFEPDAEVQAKAVEQTDQGTRFVLRTAEGQTEAHIGLHGRHQLANCLAALAVAEALKLDALSLVAELPRLTPGAGRGRLLRLSRDVVVLDDAYNSNPEALSASARALPDARRKLAVVGDMLELGPEQERFHRDAGRELAELGFELVLGVGELGSLIARAAKEHGAAETYELANASDATKILERVVNDADAILVKGSRAVGLDSVVTSLVEWMG